MMNGICGSGGCSMQQMQGMQRRQGQGQGERFNKLDTDGDGAINQTELKTMTDTMSERTGQQISVEDVSASFDANNDGLLGQDEMQTMMMSLREEMGGAQAGQGGMSSSQMLSAYQMDPEQDLTSTLLDMFGEQEDDEENNSYSPVNLQA